VVAVLGCNRCDEPKRTVAAPAPGLEAQAVAPLSATTLAAAPADVRATYVAARQDEAGPAARPDGDGALAMAAVLAGTLR
jgi:hypothetical protein